MLQLTSGLRRIVLVRATSFEIGRILVDPPTRSLRVGERSEMLEPRVMQVLVALAEANGAVVSRDDLIDRCWDGRIVGDNAINRAISQIRQAATSLAPGTLEIETINKVGYRLMGTPRPMATPSERLTAAPPAKSRASRRAVLLRAGALTSAVVIAGGLWWREQGRSTNPKALELYVQGTSAQKLGTPDQVVQAIAFFEAAVAADPEFPDAWGALALAYRHSLSGYAEGDARLLRGKAEAAVERALTLDKGNADAALARIILEPSYRRWSQYEAQLRAFVDDHPRHWLGLGMLAQVYQEVGRFNEAIVNHRQALAIDPLLPVGRALMARAFSMAGRVQECDDTLSEALRIWPSHPVLWNVRVNSLMYQDRGGEALAFAFNPATRPQGLPKKFLDMVLMKARALAGDDSVQRARAAEAARAEIARDISATPTAAPLLAVLGSRDEAFAALARYYSASPAPEADRLAAEKHTAVLFAPSVRRYVSDPRHAALLKATGLEAYYRASGSQPDFRRAG
jgi:DNA-binding winged helix-turn-helix (wHTH) protein/tetratricopeptide (TPR) repeat protein